MDNIETHHENGKHLLAPLMHRDTYMTECFAVVKLEIHFIRYSLFVFHILQKFNAHVSILHVYLSAVCSKSVVWKSRNPLSHLNKGQGWINFS